LTPPLAPQGRALECHRLEILAEIDLRHTLRKHLAVDFRPYLILSDAACHWRTEHSRQGTTLVLFFSATRSFTAPESSRRNLAGGPSHHHWNINHVDLMWTAREVQQALDEVETFAESRQRSRHSEAAIRPPADVLRVFLDTIWLLTTSELAAVPKGLATAISAASGTFVLIGLAGALLCGCGIAWERPQTIRLGACCCHGLRMPRDKAPEAPVAMQFAVCRIQR
jgi:hypothetical protein